MFREGVERGRKRDRRCGPRRGGWGLLFTVLMLLLGSVAPARERPRVEVPYGDQVFILTADLIETLPDGRISARGSVVATYGDARLESPAITYDPETQWVSVEGPLEISRVNSWLRGSRAELDVRTNTGTIHEAYGFTDEELFVRAETLRKTGPGTYVAENGYLTSCEDAVPKWSFRISRAVIDTDRSARFSHTLFRVKQLPLFYLPYVAIPTGGKERATGFMLPTTGTSTNKGRRVTNRFYLVLGQSADLLIEQDYYSLRGLGSNMNFRARPNEATFLDLSGDFVDDRLGRGGASLDGTGLTRFGGGFRAVADFSLVSNFRYRQTFSDNFFTATRPVEGSRWFLTNNTGSRSFNILLLREETFFPTGNIVTQALPSFQFRLMGQRLSRSPFYMDLESSVAGMNRSDALIETPRVSQRLDLFPRIYGSVHLFQGLRLTPSLGVRETYYSDRLDLGEEGADPVSGRSLHRRYSEFAVELTGWGLSRFYGDESGTRWKHVIEPQMRYRLIDGIDDFDRTLRFDHIDAIASTNEIEYAVVNRLFVRSGPRGASREWMAVKVGQKYFFDPTFGHAIREGAINQFFPLNTLTGLPYAVGERDFSPVTAVVRLTPRAGSIVDIRGDYDTQTGHFQSYSLTGSMQRNLLTLAATYFVTRELVAGVSRANQFQGRVGVGDQNRGFSTFTAFSYDAQAERLLNHLVRANYFWDCCGVSFEVGGFNIQNRQERQIRFSFFLKGIGSFGTLRRPDSLF
jgi:LPS-assembly protein